MSPSSIANLLNCTNAQRRDSCRKTGSTIKARQLHKEWIHHQGLTVQKERIHHQGQTVTDREDPPSGPDTLQKERERGSTLRARQLQEERIHP